MRFYDAADLKYGREMSEKERQEYLHAPFPALGPYERIFAGLHSDLIPYYRSWTHDAPLVIGPEREEELRRLSDVLYRCCSYYAGHYREYLGRLPYGEEILALLEMAEDHPFLAGTWRPDFLICEDGSLRVCEITSRFFGNGYFLSYFTEHAAKVFAQKAGLREGSGFEQMLSYLAHCMEGKKKLLVLMSSDPSDSIRLYVPFYQALGMEVQLMHAKECLYGLEIPEDTAVVSAMNQSDLLGCLTKDQIRLLLERGMRNDLRSVFLLHDKRFFSLMGDEGFTSKFLTGQEREFLRAHIVPTYVYGEHPEVWEEARIRKDGYILKHRCLGKSESVYAGCLSHPSVWEDLFRSGRVKEMILQPFMKQRVFPTMVNGRLLKEYICGTLLTVDDRYFGCGLFRTSTRPVINQSDAHKAAGLCTSSVIPEWSGRGI